MHETLEIWVRLRQGFDRTHKTTLTTHSCTRQTRAQTLAEEVGHVELSDVIILDAILLENEHHHVIKLNH